MTQTGREYSQALFSLAVEENNIIVQREFRNNKAKPQRMGVRASGSNGCSDIKNGYHRACYLLVDTRKSNYK